VLAARAERRADLAAERDDPFWHPPADLYDPDETAVIEAPSTSAGR
jgi:hypothetical protein